MNSPMPGLKKKPGSIKTSNFIKRNKSLKCPKPKNYLEISYGNQKTHDHLLLATELFLITGLWGKILVIS